MANGSNGSQRGNQCHVTLWHKFLHTLLSLNCLFAINDDDDDIDGDNDNDDDDDDDNDDNDDDIGSAQCSMHTTAYGC